MSEASKMCKYIGVSTQIKTSVRDRIAASAKENGRSMAKQMALILSKEAERLAKKAN